MIGPKQFSNVAVDNAEIPDVPVLLRDWRYFHVDIPRGISAQRTSLPEFPDSARVHRISVSYPKV